jgi:hypothetical protein
MHACLVYFTKLQVRKLNTTHKCIAHCRCMGRRNNQETPGGLIGIISHTS